MPDQPSPDWFQLEWPDAWAPEHIAAKEMVPVVIAAALWGRSWFHKKVNFLSDNSQVVAAIGSGTSRHKTVAHLTRCLFFIAASFQFVPSATHIPGRCNTAADALSRDQLAKFFQFVPLATPLPSPIPAPLQDWVLDPTGCWTSPNWRERFARFMGKVYPIH